MNIKQETCGLCGGSGKWGVWKDTMTPDNNGIRSMRLVEEECPQCNRKGYIEYAQFTVEEAKTILKFCGLTTES